MEIIEKFGFLSHNTDSQGNLWSQWANKFRTDKREYCFTQWVSKPWNLLPVEVMRATSMDGFKRVLDSWKINTSMAASHGTKGNLHIWRQQISEPVVEGNIMPSPLYPVCWPSRQMVSYCMKQFIGLYGPLCWSSRATVKFLFCTVEDLSQLIQCLQSWFLLSWILLCLELQVEMRAYIHAWTWARTTHYNMHAWPDPL